MAPLRIGIVGVGPKGLFALDALESMLREGAGTPFDLHLFEPHHAPGAGPVYDPGQADHLRMNFHSESIGIREASESFCSWARCTHPRWADPAAYAPRALVGEYLHACFKSRTERLSGRARIQLHPWIVTGAQFAGGSWTVQGESEEVVVDELLIATGHASRRSLNRPPPHPALIPSVYPVSQRLSLCSVPAGSTVAIRGFGLTSMDAILTLLGRIDGTRPRHIVPYSRSGRPMVPKADPGSRGAATSPPSAFWEEGRARVAGSSTVVGMEEILVTTAADAWCSRTDPAGSHSDPEGPVRRHLQWLLQNSVGRVGGETPREALGRGLAVARGTAHWDPERALGETWRGLYPGFVEAVGNGRIAIGERPRFRRLCHEMERISFGPPAFVVERMIEGVDEGIVDLTFLDDPRVEFGDGVHLVGAGGECTADRLIDAVLDPPGATPGSSSLLRELLRDGYLCIEPGTEGVSVARDGSAIGRDGERTPGLAVIGRPTEGSVLGNDTLSRTLHRHPTEWAERVGRRIMCTG